MNEHDQPTDLKDRLTDRALSELLGGDAPPDLSERILSAASQQPLATPVPGDPAMNETRPTSTSKRRHWAIFAVAASLFIAVGWLVANRQFEDSRQAQVSTPSDKAESTTNTLLPLAQSLSEDAQSSSIARSTIGLPGLINEAYSSPQDGDEVSTVVVPQQIEMDAVSEQVSVPLASPFFDITSSPRLLEQLNERAPRVANEIAETEEGKGIFFERAPKSGEQSGPEYSREVRNSSLARTSQWSFGGGDGGELGGSRNIGGPRNRGISGNGVLNFAPRGHGYYGRKFRNVPEELQEGAQGRGPGNSGDQYTRIYENPFIEAQGEHAVSTFSIDVDTASYANVRQFLMQSGQLPPPDAVRLEELVNYFDYDYSGPTSDVPFAAHVEGAGCPWQPEHRLVRIGIKGHEIERTKRPQSNLVFLIDVSGSMNEPAKLPLLIAGMKMLTRELGENDRVAIVVYASSEGLALPSTRGDQQATILAALGQLRAGGSTAGGAGIELAYQTAQDNFIEGGTNRVILCTDGDFNVGVTSTAELERMAETKAKESGIFLTVLGFGRGNLNDAMMEAISGKGNGNYHYIDNQTEARKVLVEEMAGTLVTIAKDVKIQVEFNPAQVAGYRLLGYENRMLRTEDFNDDKKDAGEIGAGHTVTALYEIVPTGKAVGTPSVDPLKYQQPAKPASEGAASDELLTLKIRYKQPDGDTSTKLEFPISDAGGSFATATDDFQFAAAVASFGMLLRDSEHRGNASYAAVLKIAENGAKRDPHGYRAEFLQLVERARQLVGE